MTTTTFALAAQSRPSGARRALRRRADDPIHLLPVPIRQLRLEVLLWAFRHGQPVDADALTCILLAKDSHLDDPFTIWTADSVRRLLWVDIVALCGALDRRPPALVAPTMWTLLDFFHSTQYLAVGSDPLESLREPLIDSGGVGRRRRANTSRGRHPAAR
ncbi:MAG: hypothetical protein ABI658_25605 [Acidimicrobiales bacterium]